MCFSATASFVAGTALSVAGIATVAKVTRKSEIPFALIPLLLGVQQIAEGFVWLSLDSGTMATTTVAPYAFMIFSHVFWPIYIPYAVLSLERFSWRKKVLRAFLFLGAGVSIYCSYLLYTLPLVPQVVYKHVVYGFAYPNSRILLAFYTAVICFSFLLSSNATARLFGALIAVSLAITYYFYSFALISVWCLFSAILSTIIYLYFSKRQLR